jgi:bis(5'-nucleosyl)-tetraphosphatase (symmetrical)
MTTYAIGDVQGCYDELRRLLDLVAFGDQDHLWFTGDLVNRGPQSLAVLRFVRDLDGRATVVLGNHDLHLVAVAADPRQRRRTDESLDAVLAASDRDELIDWLRNRPLLHEDIRLGTTLIHAGLPPQWDLAVAKRCASEVEGMLHGPDHRALLADMYGDEPSHWDQCASEVDRWRFTINCFTRLRYCTPDGRLALSHKGPPGIAGSDLPWFQHPDRRSRGTRLVFGHWSTLGRVAWPDESVWGIDTGCVWGGALTALNLESGELTALPCPAQRAVD